MKKILCLSRKDIKHQKFGGSEVVMHAYLKGLVALGYEVTQISTNSINNSKTEILDGVHIVRLFSLHSIYFLFPFYYLFFLRGKYDVIIDHAGGIPLLSPLYIWKLPILFFTHHVGNRERSEYFQQWIRMGWIGNIFKWIYNTFVLGLYHHKKTITVSQGTADELHSLGFKNVLVIKNTTALSLSFPKNFQKEQKLLMIGRVVPNKRVEHGIFVVDSLKKQGMIYSLDILGNTQDQGEFQRLQLIIKDHGLEDQIKFRGMVSDDMRNAFLGETKYLLLTSIKEGFGIVVLEANARGVPALAYDIPGVRDAVISGENGFLFEDGNFESIVSYIAVDTQENYQELVAKTQDFITMYPTWKDNVEMFEKILLQL